MSDWNGAKWIRRDKRLAIYMRDGLACAYCGDGIEDGAQLSLDHLTPRSRGGGNDETNLVTCCKRCNSARGNRSWIEFAEAVAVYLDVDRDWIVDFIFETIYRDLDRDRAREIIARRSSFTEAVKDAAS